MRILRRPITAPGAFTLVEMLVAMTASLILFGTVMTIFQMLSETVGRSRRAGRLDEDICGVITQLRQDLAGVTANKNANGLLCPVPSGVVDGYFEVIEGPNSDLWDNAGGIVNKALNPLPDRIVGDVDDMLFFTTRSVTNQPFTGKYGVQTTTSFDAEIAYFCRPTPNTSGPQLYTLYRRQLLILGSAPVAPFDSRGSMPFTTWADFYAQYDLSARRERINGRDYFYLNTANDLQRRRNRFGHDPWLNGFAPPNDWPISKVAPANPVLAFTGARQNEDTLVTNVISFDVRLLEPDPNACERIAPNTTKLQPGDRDYWIAGATNVTSSSTDIYVDLGYNRYAANNGAATVGWYFSGYGSVPGLRGDQVSACTYDTWTTYYTSNGNVDDNSGTGDSDEGAPYPHALPGVQITVRLYDPATKTIRQKTVTQLFRGP
jgi:hypothetical protein